MLNAPLPRIRLTPLELGVLVLAVGLRVAGLQSYEATAYADHPMVDAFTYWEQAEGITALMKEEGSGLLHYWTRPSSLEGRDPFAEGFYQPPGYPVFLALLGKLTGSPDLGFTRLVQALLGVFSTAGLMALGRRLAAPWKAPWAGAAAGLLFTLYPSTLLFEQDILTPALTTALLVGALLLLVRDRAPGPVAGAGAGLLLGLAVVVHPTYLLGAAALGLGLVLSSRQADGGRPLLPAAALALGLALAIAPTTWRNVAIHQQPALVSHNSGVNFYLGNTSAWRETMFLRPGLPFRKLVLEAEPHRRAVDQRNDYWWERTRTEIADKPVVWAATLMNKALWSVNNREIPRNEDYRCRTDDGPLAWLGWLPVRYGFVFPFALVGGVLLARRPGSGRLVPATWLALHLPLIVFLVADRYRLATWPLVCLCGAVGLAAAWRAWQQRSEGVSRTWLLLLAGVLCWLPIDAVTAYDAAWCKHVDGNLALMQGEPERAAELYREALDLDPEDWGARDFLARTVYEQGDPDAAATLMEPLVAWFPDHYPTLYFMGRLEQRRRNLDAAADYMGRAYRVPGNRTNTGVRYVRLLVDAGRREEARAVVASDPKLQGHPKLAGVLD